jgi:hypothetical protein
MKTEFMMKRLGNMIRDEDYDLPERYAPSMLDEGYIVLVMECVGTGFCICKTSYYQVTAKGDLAYKQWLEEKR